MRIQFTLSLFILLALQFIHPDAEAQWGYSGFGSHRYGLYPDPIAMARKKPFQRYGVGLSYMPVSGTFGYKPIDEFGNVDTGQSVNVKGWGAGVAYSLVIPCARTGEKSLLAVNIGLNANYYLFDVADITLRRVTTTYNSTSTYSGDGAGFMFGLPVGLDLLTGGEATLDRADRFSFVVGGGFFPMMTMGFVHETAAIKFRAPLYAKAEVGFHWGINWKVRGTYIAKSPMSFFNDGQSIFDDGTLQAELKTNDRFMLTLLVQPFSFGWD